MQTFKCVLKLRNASSLWFLLLLRNETISPYNTFILQYIIQFVMVMPNLFEVHRTFPGQVRGKQFNPFCTRRLVHAKRRHKFGVILPRKCR